MTYERSFIIKFLYPYSIDKLTFCTPMPKIDFNFDILLKPFDKFLWFCLAGIFLLFHIFNYIKINCRILGKTKKWTNNEFGQMVKNNNIHDENLVWIGLFILLRQPYKFLRRMQFSIKIALAIWLLCSIILTNSYSGFLCSMFTIPSKTKIDTLNKLAEASRSRNIIILGKKNTILFDIIQVTFSFLTFFSSLINKKILNLNK